MNRQQELVLCRKILKFWLMTIWVDFLKKKVVKANELFKIFQNKKIVSKCFKVSNQMFEIEKSFKIQD